MAVTTKQTGTPFKPVIGWGFNRYDGPLIRTTGPAFSAFVPGSAVLSQVVGNASLSFTDANNGTFTHTLNGVAQTKPITRFKP